HWERDRTWEGFLEKSVAGAGTVRGENLHLIAIQADRPDGERQLGLFQALPVLQTEVLLVQGRGNHQRAMQVADHAAPYHVGAGLRVPVVDGVQLLAL